MEKCCKVRQVADGNIIRRRRTACWISKATHSDYVILTDFPLQQWLHESAPVLCHMYRAGLVHF